MSDPFAPHRPVAQAIAALLHPHAEVVIHDLKTDRVVEIWNAFSHRKAGDESLLGDDIEVQLDRDVFGPYEKAGPDGARLKSITAALRDAGPVRARAYCNPHPVGGLRPSRRYLRAVCEGARAFGLPEAYVRELEAHPSFHLPLVSDAATLLVGVVERLRYAGLRPERLRMAWQAKARARR